MKALYHGLLLACLTLLGGCFIGNKYDYDNTRTAVGYAGQGKHVAVAAWDQRPYVTNGDKDPHFVGLQRNHLGIPFNVSTTSGLPLASEMTNSMVRALANAGFAATPVTLQPGGAEPGARNALLAGQPARGMLLRVDNWESDTLINPAVFFDLTLVVYDAGGRTLAVKSVKGSDDLEGKLLGGKGTTKQIVPDLFRKKVELLLNAPEIAAALK
jgi:hypothetical protein